jgi:hypothetical protein
MAVSFFVTPARLADGLEAKNLPQNRSAAPRFCKEKPAKRWFSRAADRRGFGVYI